MLDIALNVAFAAITLAMVLNLYRLVKGPDLADRAISLDTLYVNAIAIVILLGLRFHTGIFFEAALIIAMLGFISTVAFAKYLERGNIIE